jgi:hypothetical protein
MKYFLILITYTLIGNLLIASDLIIDIFGKEKVKIYKIDESNYFRIYSSSGVFKTSSNIYGNTECDGTTEIYNKETLFNIICEFREGENISHYIFKNNITTKGTEKEVSTKVIFVGGTGSWKRLIGTSCTLAYVEFDEGASHTKIKCKLK